LRTFPRDDNADYCNVLREGKDRRVGLRPPRDDSGLWNAQDDSFFKGVILSGIRRMR